MDKNDLFFNGVSKKTDSKSDLRPWKVICSYLLDLKESDDIKIIVNRAGLNVDWALTEQESYSHKTRKRAYSTKIEAAYNMLSEEKQLLVAGIVAKELAGWNDKYRQELDTGLRRIGWKMESDRLTTEDVDVLEMFFPKGTPHDAYLEVKKILSKAKSTIIVIDPYLDSSIFQMIKTISAKSMKVLLLSYNLPSDFTLEAKKFITQYSHFSLEIRKTKEFHDRFVILDDTQCYHIGASIKDAGQKAFMISRIEDNKNSDALVKQQQQTWQTATQFKF